VFRLSRIQGKVAYATKSEHDFKGRPAGFDPRAYANRAVWQFGDADETARWEALIGRFATTVAAAGYGLVQSPMFEDVSVFQRVGDGTDVVRKEMYEFEDKGGRRLALRPEGTASIVRAFVQHRPPTPWKVWYAAPNFRYERPQAGRFRQHHQLGIEAIGSPDPDLDVEVIALGWDFLASLGLQRITLQLNSMGTRDDRARYVEVLRDWLAARLGALDEADREKVADHPLRVLDSKRPKTRTALEAAPVLSDHLSEDGTLHAARVKAGLTTLGIPFTENPRLVRGLDYYTHTTFEFVAGALDAAQSTVLGGGRYDGLVAEMGGPPTPGIGFGSGIERVLLACDAEGVYPVHTRGVDVFVIDTTGGTGALALTTELRRAGVSAGRAFDHRSMRAQMKAADRSGADLAIIIGEQERADGVVSIRALRGAMHEGDDAQQQIPRSELAGRLPELLASLQHAPPADPPA
jgi:histidyl-tRNA synthetase